MLAPNQMRFAAQAMAAIFGGPGLFYIYLSFYSPWEAVTGIFYLAIATALALYADRTGDSRPVGGGPGPLRKAVIRKRRR
jgi:hypothetical protein